MKTTLLGLAAVAGLLSGCGQSNGGQGDNTQGPAVSTSEAPRNPAIDTTPTTGDAPLTPGANSFTEAQARSAIESAGYTNVSALTQNEAGFWQGKASKSGTEMDVSVDYKGAVTTQ
jgi:hypothetical protein